MRKEQIDNFKGIFWLLLNLTLVFVIFFSIMGMSLLARESNAVVPSRTITVSGEGKVNVVPDLATLNFSVVSQGQDPEVIQDENNEKMNAAIDFLKEQGIESKDIKTSGYELYPQYDYSMPVDARRQPEIIGYEMRQTVTVKIRDFDKANMIVGSLPGFGINQISSLYYSVEDPDAQRDQARQEAFDMARAKAKAMAKANGVRIARVISFSESDYGYPPILYAKAEAMGRGGEDMAMNPSLQPGSEDVVVNVSVTYEIR